MAYIKLNDEKMPGITGLLDYRPETAKPLSLLAETLLRGESSLTRGERELIASSVSFWNDCTFCHLSHGAAAAHLDRSVGLLDDIKDGLKKTEITPKLQCLLKIARQVQLGGKNVTVKSIEAARSEGATDQEIHDTVLIAAAFCMFNRYVDGLGTWAPAEKSAYLEMGRLLAEQGYLIDKSTAIPK